MAPKEPLIHIDDSDVVKPQGYHFESHGIVRDGSRSTPEKSVYCKGYHVTEACVLTDSNHPVSIFSELHSSNGMGKGFCHSADAVQEEKSRKIGLTKGGRSANISELSGEREAGRKKVEKKRKKFLTTWKACDRIAKLTVSGKRLYLVK